MNILIVDDDPLQREIMAANLGSAGHNTVAAAASGQAAIARVEAGGIDLVLMDMVMVDMSGAEAMRRIRGLPKPAGDVPIVAMSISTVAQGAASADAFLAKTTAYSREAVDGALNAAIAQHRQRRATDDDKASIQVPRATIVSLAVSIILALPATIAATSWWFSQQAVEARHVAELVTQTRTELAVQRQADGVAIQKLSDALEKGNREQNDLTNRIDVRLTRIEATMSFVAATGGGKR